MNNKNYLNKLALAFAAVYGMHTPVWADNSSGSIYGQAKAGSTITLVSPQTGLKRQVTADANGRYRFVALPVGKYQVSSSGEKFDVNVNIGTGTNVAFGGDNTEVISVVGQRIAAIDTSSVESTTVFSADELSSLPVPRNLTSVALLAPGTVAGDTGFGDKKDGFYAAIGGASVAENGYYLNGFDITNARTLLGFATLPFEAISQQQIKTGGYGAEYGRSLGGVINVVSKKGSNEWEFGASAYLAPSAWRASARDAVSIDPGTKKYQAYRSADTTDTRNYVLQGGGPLLEDKLFIYSAVELVDNEWHDYQPATHNSGRITMAEETTSPRGLLKLDWHITENHLFEFTGLLNKRKVHQVDYQKPEAEAFSGHHGTDILADRQRNDGGNLLIGKYTGIITDDFTLSATVGRLYAEIFDTPDQLEGWECPRVWDGRTNPALDYKGCWNTQQVDIRDPNFGPNTDQRVAFRLDAEYRFGDHTLRAGVDMDEWESGVAGKLQTGVGHNNYYYRYYKTGPNGGTVNLVKLPANTEYIRTWDRGTASAKYTVQNSAFYLEDSWQLTEQWLIYGGLRLEGFENTNADGVNFVEAKNNVAPRLGFTYDLAGDSSQKVFGTLGRYYIPVAANTNIRAAGVEWFDTRYWLHTSAEDPKTGAPVQLGPEIGKFIPADRSAANPATIAASNLSPMYQDELILGYQAELNDEWTGGVKYINRQVGDGMDDYCSAQPFVDWAKDKGYKDFDYHSLAHCIIMNPGKDLQMMIDIAGDGVLVDSTVPNSYLKLPEYKREYQGLEFTLGRAKSDGWYLQASYLLSFSKGNAEGYVNSTLEQDDAGLTQDFDHERFMTNTEGYLPNDRRHALKLFGGFDLTDELMISATLNVTSGRPVNCNGYVPLDGLGVDQSNLGNYAASAFYCVNDKGEAKATTRGQFGRTPWTKDLGLSLRYIPSWANDQLEAQLNIQNLLNSSTVTKYNETGDYGRTETRKNLNFLTPTDFQAPRYAEVVLRYKF